MLLQEAGEALAGELTPLVGNDYGPTLSGFNSMYNVPVVAATSKRLKPTKFEAALITLDEYVARYSLTPNFVKTDAESADYQVLRGMDGTLNRCHPAISVEVGDMDIDGVPSSRDIVLYLINKGYQPYEHIDGRVVKHRPKDRYGYGDLMFLWES